MIKFSAAAQSAEYGSLPFLLHIIRKEAAPAVHLNIGKRGTDPFQHGNSFFGGKSAFFADVDHNRHGNMVKNSCGSGNQVQMSPGNRIKGSRKNTGCHALFTS